MEEAKIVLIPVDDIIPNRFQPRLRFNEKELQSLAESISIHGIVSPIIVRRIGEKFEIIAGERRFKAANLVGLTKVPCIIKELDDNESAEIAVIENLQRSNLTPIEEARSYEKLLSKGMTQDELARRLGVSQPTIANKVRLLNLTPEVQDALLHNRISERHARSLLSIADPNLQNNLLNTIITNRLTVRQTDIEVSTLLGKNISAAGSEDIFNININEVKDNSEDIIKEHKEVDFESLLKKDIEPTPIQKPVEQPKPQEKVMNIEPPKMVNDFDISSIPGLSKEEPKTPSFDPVPEEEWINPFQGFQQNNNSESAKNNAQDLELFDEYLSGNTININEVPLSKEKSPELTKRISNVINATRNMKSELESIGIDVDTEESEDDEFYQITIKVKKD